MYQSNKKLSILHIVLSIGETNATYNEHCLPLAEERDIAICTYFKSDIKPPDTISYLEGDNSLFGFIRALKKALEYKEYDVIHAHTPHVGFLFLLATILSSQRVKSSTVITVHDSYQNFKIRNRFMYLPVFASFQKVVCCSQASFESFPFLYKQLASDRLGFVQNGLDIARVDRIDAQSSQHNDRTNTFKLIAISRLVDIKNPSTILNAFIQSKNQKSSLRYIGDGPLRQQLIKQGSEAGPDKYIEFNGLIPREKVFEHLLSADLFISTSLGEGLPIAVLEAMACRCPVLLSDIPPHREIAESVDFIPLIKPYDITSFAREFDKFYEMSVSERLEIGQKCRELVEERFSLNAMHDGYKKVYDGITNNHKIVSILEMGK